MCSKTKRILQSVQHLTSTINIFPYLFYLLSVYLSAMNPFYFVDAFQSKWQMSWYFSWVLLHATGLQYLFTECFYCIMWNLLTMKHTDLKCTFIEFWQRQPPSYRTVSLSRKFSHLILTPFSPANFSLMFLHPKFCLCRFTQKRNHILQYLLYVFYYSAYFWSLRLWCTIVLYSFLLLSRIPLG